MAVPSDIFKEVCDYLEHHITLEELEDWLAPNLGMFLSLPPNDASELAGTIELGLAEMTKSHRTEDEFRALLKEFVGSRDTIFVASVQSPDYTSSAYRTYPHTWEPITPLRQQHPEWKYADIKLGTVS